MVAMVKKDIEKTNNLLKQILQLLPKDKKDFNETRLHVKNAIKSLDKVNQKIFKKNNQSESWWSNVCDGVSKNQFSDNANSDLQKLKLIDSLIQDQNKILDNSKKQNDTKKELLSE
jgi:uncharacterized protein YdiU (UPF0061 family)